MICFPNAKINIGLHVVEKRKDGFHAIETVFYPLALCDVLEIIKNNKNNDKNSCSFHSSGIHIDGAENSNLCVKAYHLLANDFLLPAVEIHLHKIIPVGAGLGGGSSDASYTIKTLKDYFELHLSEETMMNYARQIGSDCAFFIISKPVFAFSRGDEFESISLNLKDFCFAVVTPPVHINTADAYSQVIPCVPSLSLRQLITIPVNEWKDNIKNDFENSVFVKYPEIKHIKEMLYAEGAVYASMSGSGSSVYGMFSGTDMNNLKNRIGMLFPSCRVWVGN